ncbi:MAG: hypothetical protein JRH15_00175, partial [Deltaproteobacteria bacterium]|nr:hypothetical protein [Deltaproteobacteria bacterium]
MKTKTSRMAALSAFLFMWATASLTAAPPDWNELFDECPDNQCGAPPSGGVGGGGGGGGPLIVSYTWGPTFSVQEDVDAD